MKHCLKLCTLLVALSLPALATSVDFTNAGGTLAGTTAGLILTGSTLTGAFSGSLSLTGDLGALAFQTGALSSGTLANGGTFAAGGSFIIAGNGTAPLPNGTIFSGGFDAPATWAMITLSNGTHNYTLTGTLSGTFFNGQHVSGVTVQLTVNTGTGFYNGSAPLSSGDTTFSGKGARFVTPEPASLLYFSTGILGLAGVARRKLRL